MAYNLIITPKAALDIVNACTYYESMQAELSNRFLSELGLVYEKLEINPQHYSYISFRKKSKLRDIKLKTFPYVAIFDITLDVVTIYAIMSTYQKPGLVNKRIKQ